MIFQFLTPSLRKNATFSINILFSQIKKGDSAHVPVYEPARETYTGNLDGYCARYLAKKPVHDPLKQPILN